MFGRMHLMIANAESTEELLALAADPPPPDDRVEVAVPRLSRREPLHRIGGPRTARNRREAAQLDTVAGFARRARDPDGVAQEPTLGLSISRHTAQSRVGLGQAPTARPSRTLAAMRHGQLTGSQSSDRLTITTRPPPHHRRPRRFVGRQRVRPPPRSPRQAGTGDNTWPD
jgi:hypothetical protein